MPHTKLFDNHRQIVSVGPQKEWSSSQCSLLSSKRRFKPFVSVRVGEIQTNTDPTKWKHIPGEMNVADDVSRGIPVRNLVERRQHGLKFLRLSEKKWPQDSPTSDQPKVEKECRKVYSICVQTRVEHPINCHKFSSWKS